jgi:general secretion pathway protein D
VISSVVPDASGSTTSSLTPTISKRRIASDISVKSGQSVLLAGLISDNRTQSKGQVPFLGGVSDLLGNKDNRFSRNELVVFIRPVIIRDGKDATSVVYKP